MAKLQGEIGRQNYEVVRDQIGAVLRVELDNQYTAYHGLAELRPDVYVERLSSNRFGVEELPAINVQLAEGDYSNKDEDSVRGHYVFYVDVYSKAKSVKDGNKVTRRGDEKSNVQLQRMMGMVRAILEHPDYRTLGFDAPLIERVWVSKIVIGEGGQLGEVDNDTMGRIVFNVEVPEYVELKEGVMIAGLGTQVKLYDTERGYLWGPVVNGANFVEEEVAEEPAAGVGYFIAEENTDFMGNLIRFSELGGEEVTGMSSFVGIQSDGEGGYRNVLFTPAELANYINAGSTKKRIVVETNGNTLTDSFFEGREISEIVTNNQCYLAGEAFTQDGDTITGVTIAFYEGQVLVAKI